MEGYDKHEADYVSNRIQTRTWPYGLDAEVFSFEVLESAFYKAKESYEREHVTPYIYRNPLLFKLREVPLERDLSAFRLSVDYPEDFELCKYLIEHFRAESLNWEDLISILNSYPELTKPNERYSGSARVVINEASTKKDN